MCIVSVIFNSLICVCSTTEYEIFYILHFHLPYTIYHVWGVCGWRMTVIGGSVHTSLSGLSRRSGPAEGQPWTFWSFPGTFQSKARREWFSTSLSAYRRSPSLLKAILAQLSVLNTITHEQRTLWRNWLRSGKLNWLTLKLKKGKNANVFCAKGMHWRFL